MAACRKTGQISGLGLLYLFPYVLTSLVGSVAWRNSTTTLQQRFYSAPTDGHIPAAKKKYVPASGTFPKGFLVSGTHVGVKPTNTHFPDLAILSSERPCSAAAVFTKNRFQAAPVTVSREALKKRSGEGIRAIIINSGCANAVTGKGGLEDANTMAAAVDGQYSSASGSSEGSSTLVMSTGTSFQTHYPHRYSFFRLPTYQESVQLHLIMTSISHSTSER